MNKKILYLLALCGSIQVSFTGAMYQNIFKKGLTLTKTFLQNTKNRKGSYLFYKKQGKNITPITIEEYAKIYPLELQNTFPTCTHPHIKTNLSLEDINAISTDNRSFLQEKIASSIDPEIQVAWLPSDLTAALFYQKQSVESFNDKSPPLDYIDFFNCKTKEELLSVHERYRPSHENMNSYMVNYLAQNYPTVAQGLADNNQLSVTDATSITQKLYQYLPNFRPKKQRNLSKNIREDKNIITRSIEEEYAAEEQGNQLLYRGSGGLEWTHKRYKGVEITQDGPVKELDPNARPLRDFLFGKKLVPHSVSLGTSLFAGSERDEEATAYNYIQKMVQGYCVSIGKQAYLTGGAVYNYFFIPALTTLQSFYSWGETFHARSRTYHRPTSGIADNHDGHKTTFIDQELQVGKQSWWEKVVSWFKPDEKEKSFNTGLSSYLQNNRTWLKNKSYVHKT